MHLLCCQICMNFIYKVLTLLGINLLCDDRRGRENEKQ